MLSFLFDYDQTSTSAGLAPTSVTSMPSVRTPRDLTSASVNQVLLAMAGSVSVSFTKILRFIFSQEEIVIVWVSTCMCCIFALPNFFSIEIKVFFLSIYNKAFKTGKGLYTFRHLEDSMTACHSCCTELLQILMYLVKQTHFYTRYIV